MRAPAPKRSDDEAAIEEASRRLRQIFNSVVSWSEQGAVGNSPTKKLEAAIGLVEGALGEAERALNEASKCALNKEAADAIADAIPFIKLARKDAVPELQQARPAKGRHGRHGDLNASRDQAIAETVASVCAQFGLSQEQASSIVSEALKRLVSEHRKALKRLKARGAWVDEYQNTVVDKLVLSEKRVAGIAKKHRTTTPK
jgi:hypothetical protein